VADIKSEPRPASNRNRWPASYWNAWPASSESAFDHFVVKRPADSTGRDKLDYALSVRVGPSSGAVNDFTFQLVYLPTNVIVWWRSFPQISRGDSASIDRVTDAVVSAVGDTQVGAIMAHQRRRAARSNSPLQGYFCFVAAYDYILSRSLAKRGPARECLEREVSLNSRDPHALTLLSVILIDDYINLLPDNQGLADIERVATLAQLAFEISPCRSETSTIMFRSRFYARRFDDAFAIIPQLLQYLPNSRLLSANVGVAYIARGRYDEGMAILSRLEEANLGAPAFSVPMLALAAHMRGDEETAERFASRPTAARQPMGLVVRIAVCETEKNQVCVLEASQQLLRDYPGFAADLPTALFRHALADDIRAKLLADLRAAGFFGEASR
jgi:tetratricopeptide (TPR) repeat protein